MNETNDTQSGRALPGYLAGYAAAVFRCLLFSSLAIALLVAAVPAKSSVHFDRGEAASTFSPVGPAILRHDLAAGYLVDLNAKMEWTRVSNSAKTANLDGQAGLLPSSSLAARTPVSRSFASCAPRAWACEHVSPYNAQAPPESV
jgi:hypothetical protein